MVYLSPMLSVANVNSRPETPTAPDPYTPNGNLLRKDAVIASRIGFKTVADRLILLHVHLVHATD